MLAALALLTACSGAPERRPEGARDDGPRPPLPEVADRYEALHRVRVTFGGTEVAVLSARLFVTVIERRPDEAELSIVAQLLADDRSVAATDELRATLRADGALAGGARSRCVDGEFDELVSTRLVDATLGARPGRTDRMATIRTELDEAEARAGFVPGSEPGSLRGEATLTLRAGAVAGEVFRGSVQVVARHTFEPGDLLAGRSRTILSGDVETARGVRGLLEVVSDTEVRRYEGDAVAAPCRGGFDGATVIAALGARRHAIRACYETALAVEPTLGGRLVFELVVQPSGETTDVAPTEGPEGPIWRAVGECVVEVLAGIRLAEGPPEPTAFAAPFVFTPEE